MSVNSDTSRSVREEAHQKLDALLYSISSRQLERVYGITPTKDSDAASSELPPVPTPRLSASLPTAASSSGRRSRERTPPTVRWEDERIDEDDLKETVPTARRLSFPPSDDLRKKIDDVKQKQKRAEQMTAKAASVDDRLLFGGQLDEDETEREKLAPYVDALLNYVHYLESERAGFAGEMEKLRRNVAVVVKENAHLHKEMKRGFLEAVVSAASGNEDAVDADESIGHVDALERMHSEIETLNKRHQLELTNWKDKVQAAERERDETLQRLAAMKEEEDERENREWRERSGSAESKRIADSLLKVILK